MQTVRAEMFSLDRYRDRLLQLHDHICPRQILGLRMGELAGRLLNISLPQKDKRLFVFVETDGCFADGVMVATGCSLGHRTLRLMDQGKVAATFVDTRSDPYGGLRIWPRPTIRQQARALCPDLSSRWHAQLEAYQRMPDDELLAWARVELVVSVKALISRPGVRATCDRCGEEIINERERWVDGMRLCAHCAGEAYFASPIQRAESAEAQTPA
ncbi:MAG: FmdE family protein [Anaerolineae bacterium]|nr:FmdE family protein [Candidatus Roseilinea sp.]MDW8451626.1 FmdE family protein [Anaerolineae bacterium]